MMRKYELTRTELPAKEGHRGRKPCEWRIGEFVIPKSLTCIGCNTPKITNKDQFVGMLQKTSLTPEEIVKGYLCRSCRPSKVKVPKAKVVKVSKPREIKPAETFQEGKFELTRVELPVADNHRGRTPCEWRIGEFVIPKSLTCCECDQGHAVSKNSFMTFLEKTGLSPKRFVKKYICRSCRKSMRDNDETVKLGKCDESKVVEPIVNFETKTRGAYMSGYKIGMIVKGKPIVFYASEMEFEDRGFSYASLGCATEVYELTRGRCFRHMDRELTDKRKHEGMRKFAKVQDMYNFEDMEAVLKKMMNGGLK